MLRHETGKAVTCSALFITPLASTILHGLLEQWLSLGAFPHSFVEQEWRSFLVGAQGSGVPTFALAAAAPPFDTPSCAAVGMGLQGPQPEEQPLEAVTPSYWSQWFQCLKRLF